MKKGLLILATVCLLATIVPAGAAFCQMLYPYDPMNAVAAHPPTPYNLDLIPRWSRTAYLPCPTCGPLGASVPDWPPINEALRGPFGIPVPVP